MKKKDKVGIIIVAAMIAVILLSLLGIRLGYRLPVRDFYGKSDKEFKLVDTGKGFEAEGVCYDAERNIYYVSGVMKDGSKTPIYLMDGSKHRVLNKVFLRLSDNSIFSGNASSIACANGYVYIADPENHRILIVDRSLMEFTAKGHPVPVIGTFSTEYENDFVTPCFLTVANGRLFAGETKDDATELSGNHKLTAENGTENQAMVVGYTISKGNEFGLKKAPAEGYSIPDGVHGIAVDDGKIYLSFSNGKEYSAISLYNANAAKKQEVTVGETTLSVRVLTDNEIVKTMKAMPAAEGLLLRGEELLIMNSAAGKYFFGKLTDANWCYKLDTKYFE